MYKVSWPSKYMHTTNINDPIETIWDAIDGYTYEYQSFDPERQKSWVSFVAAIPPVKYENKLVKGVFYSQGAEVIIEKHPKLKELFFVCANSMFSGYPYAKTADILFVCYNNPKRVQYYLNKYKEREGTIFVPLQDADFTNEYVIAPTPNTLKTIDVLMVASAYPFKNLPMFAQSLLEYEKLYGKKLKATLILGSNDVKKNEDGTIDFSKLRSDAKGEMEKVQSILKNIPEYLNVIPRTNHGDLPKYYTSAKCVALTSLLEGKNRCISEAMSCNTPVVVFKDHNKYSRGDHPVFFGNSGEYVEHYDAKELAQTINKVINNQKDYRPRYNYLKHYGRKNFINTMADYIPYYKKAVPEYEHGKLYDNIWFDLAIQNNYQVSFHDYIYGKKDNIMNARGLEQIATLANYYLAKFKIK